MKLPITCGQCMQEDISTACIVATVEFRDDGRYEVTCPKGHISTTILQQQKFEVLFEIGAYAIVDGYYREAVSSFTSALERFYEFCIKIICLSKGHDWDSILETWKNVSNQSERQLGAFIFLHHLELGSKPTLLKNKTVQFRNEIIHKGKIPNRGEAINYGQEVLDIIRPIISWLEDTHKESVQKSIFHHLNAARTQDDQGRAVSTLGISTILSLSIAEASHHQRTLEAAISELRKW